MNQVTFDSRALPFALGDGEVISDVQWQDHEGYSFVVALTSLGRVLQQPSGGGDQVELHNIADHIDLALPTKIYCSDQYIAIVNEFGTNGIVLNSVDRSWTLPLHREDYHAEHCAFPIAFIGSESEKRLLHATLWNRLDLTDLRTGHCLTDRTVDYETDTNYLDYFLCRLHLAPNEKYFVSSGWVWSPKDILCSWHFETFRETYEPSGSYPEQPEDFEWGGYVFDRPVCFINDTHIAWGFNRSEEPEEPTNQNDAPIPSEIAISDVTTDKLVERIPFDHFAFEAIEQREVIGTLLFDAKTDCFITFSQKRDLIVADRKGIEIGRKAVRPHAFSVSALSGLSINGSDVEITTLQISERAEQL